MTGSAPLVLYVYHCTKCGDEGQVHLEESALEVTTACSVCGAEVIAESDGGVVLRINRSNDGKQSDE